MTKEQYSGLIVILSLIYGSILMLNGIGAIELILIMGLTMGMILHFKNK